MPAQAHLPQHQNLLHQPQLRRQLDGDATTTYYPIKSLLQNVQLLVLMYKENTLMEVISLHQNRLLFHPIPLLDPIRQGQLYGGGPDLQSTSRQQITPFYPQLLLDNTEPLCIARIARFNTELLDSIHSHGHQPCLYQLIVQTIIWITS